MLWFFAESLCEVRFGGLAQRRREVMLTRFALVNCELRIVNCDPDDLIRDLIGL